MLNNTENLNELTAKWRKSYQTDPNHALRDAEKNLKGFKLNLQDALQRFSVDHAFVVAIKNTLKQHGVR